MPYRLESKRRALFDFNGDSPEWKPHLPLIQDENGNSIPVLHKKKSEIQKILADLYEENSSLFDSYKFRIVVTTSTGDTAVINNVFS